MGKFIGGMFFGIFLSALAALGYYYFYMDKDTEVKKEKKPTEEKLDVDSEEIENLFDEVNLFEIDPLASGYYYAYFTKGDSFEVKDLSNDLIGFIALKNILDDFDDLDEADSKYASRGNDKYPNGFLEVPKDDVNDAILEIFGTSVDYQDGDIVSMEDIDQFIAFKYDLDNETYIKELTNEDEADTYKPMYDHKIIEAVKKNKTLTITVKVAYFEFDNDMVNVYKNHLKETSIDSYDFTSANENEELIKDTYLDKLDTYKYTFKQKDNEYYFSKVEKVKE